MAIPRSNHGAAVTSAENQSSGGDEPAKANYDQIADYLTDGYREWAGGSRRAFDVAPGGTLTADITGLTAEGQQLARWALESWTNVSGINFRFVESDADITFDDEESNAFARPDISGNQIISSFVNVSKDWIDIFDSTIDSYSFFTYIYATGLALGLGHAGPYNSFATYRVDSIFPGDSWQATVMSFFSQTENTYIDASFAYPITPMIADIIAIQNLYGVPTDINAGDTIYGSQSNVGGYLGQFFALASGEDYDPEVYRDEEWITLTLYDTGGIDTLDWHIDTFDQRIDLRPEGISDLGGRVGNVLIARDTWIENAIAGSGNDKVIGNAVANRLAGSAGNDELWGRGGDDVLEGDAGADRLEGGAGADRLDGGAGTDTVSYSESDGAVTVDLEAGTGEGGHAEGDVIVDVENVLGSGYGDVLGGDAGANRLDGGAGVDTVSYAGSNRGVRVYLETGTGKGGHAEGDVIVDIENVLGSVRGDVLGGDAGANRLSGGGGNDRLSGRGGDDVLEGGAGADRLIGGAGEDTVSYAGSDRGVRVYLETGTGKGGHAEGDVIAQVESVLGSNYGDVLGGNDRANQLSGGGGNDRLSGRGGDDVLEGGVGADRLIGGSGEDTVSYAGSDRGVRVYLETGTGKGGHAEGDVIAQVESVLGSNYGDVLGGDNGDNQLSGGPGNDRLSGRGGDDVLEGGAGADRLIGGSGVDTVSYAGSDWGVRVDLGDGTGEEGHAEGDVIIQVENVLGSDYGDVLVGDDSANFLGGLAGDDVLRGGDGDDELRGGDGNDALWGDAGDDQLAGGAGDDQLVGDAGDDELWGNDGNDALWGDAGDDLLVGGAGDDELWGEGGDDQLAGGAGDDQLVGDAGDDELWGNDGNDALWGDAGDDLLVGGAGDDELWGEGGDDQLWGEDGNDELSGDAGADQLFGGAGDDILWGEDGDDSLSGDAGDDSLSGGAGDDDLFGDAGDDQLWGGAGDDWLWDHAGNDRFSGGGGDDVFRFDFGHGDDIITDFTDGDDVIDLISFGLSGFDELVVSSDSDGVTIDLTANGGGTIRLEGFAIADLDAGDFWFES